MTLDTWTPAPIFKDETVFILGGGPSLNRETVGRLHDRRVIAINCACYLAPWAAVLFFNDRPWLVKHRLAIEAWGGIAYTTSSIAPVHLPANVKRLTFEHRRDFPPVGSGVVRDGRSSGHKSVGLAQACGAKRIVLLGFDMRVVEGRSHFHDDHAIRDHQLYEISFIPGFRGWNAQAKAAGVEVLNATPNSALQEFPHVALDEVLS